jgi:hypothetical protein
MSATIITKNSSTASAVPSAGSLVQGELAVNVTDKKLFTKDSSGNVVVIADVNAAAASATAAASSATAAATSATSASNSASAASTSATNAATAQTAAEAARDQTLAAFDNFDDRYLGTKTSDPTLDNDGNALVAGSLYFNSVSGIMKVYTGSAWVAAYVSAEGFVTLAGIETLTGTKTFSGTSSTLAMVLNDAAEVATVSATAATGTIAYNITTQSVLFYTSNASANWTVNFRASSGTSLNTALATGQSVTVAFLVTQGSTAYFNSAVQVDGTTSGVTTRWLGGAPTAGNASGIDSYRYLIIKTGSATYTVLASVTQFKA